MEGGRCRSSRSCGRPGSLRNLVGRHGNTVETVRELIGIAPEQLAQLRAFARMYPGESLFIGRAMQFRQAVAVEFEKLMV